MRQRNKKLATSCCGTPIYQAPEVNRPEWEQSPKMDIWSLLASLLDVHPSYTFPPPRVPDHQSVVKAILEITQGLPLALRLMGRENPKYRASAAQLLLLQFGGKGLTTRREAIPEIIEDIDQEPKRVEVPATRPIGGALRRPQSPGLRQLRVPRLGMTARAGPCKHLQQRPGSPGTALMGPFSRLPKRPRPAGDELELRALQRDKRHNQGTPGHLS